MVQVPLLLHALVLLSARLMFVLLLLLLMLLLVPQRPLLFTHMPWA